MAQLLRVREHVEAANRARQRAHVDQQQYKFAHFGLFNGAMRGRVSPRARTILRQIKTGAPERPLEQRRAGDPCEQQEQLSDRSI
jgi:hypothetical protein